MGSDDQRLMLVLTIQQGDKTYGQGDNVTIQSISSNLFHLPLPCTSPEYTKIISMTMDTTARELDLQLDFDIMFCVGKSLQLFKGDTPVVLGRASTLKIIYTVATSTCTNTVATRTPPPPIKVDNIVMIGTVPACLSPYAPPARYTSSSSEHEGQYDLGHAPASCP